MCKWESIMRIFCKKKSISNRNSIYSGTPSMVFLWSSQQFCEEFKKQLTEENIQELSAVFQMINISSEVVGKSLFRFMNKRGFRSIFKTELRAYDQILQRERQDRTAITNCLRHHCFAVLSIYLEMVKFMSDPVALDNFLQEIAISHSFIREPEVCLEMHDCLLKQFMKQEFGQYMSIFTRRALKTYFRLISTRLKILMEQHNEGDNFDVTVQAMESQKLILNDRIEGLRSFQQVYVNELPRFSSQYSFVPSEAIYPGTSRGRRSSLDKGSNRL